MLRPLPLKESYLDNSPLRLFQLFQPNKSILKFSLNMSVAVRKLQAEILARSSRKISRTVRINCHSFLSRVHISFRHSKFFVDEKPEKTLSVYSIARWHLMTTGAAVAVYIDCERNVTRRNIGFPQGLQPISRHATVTKITGPTFKRKRLCSFIDVFPKCLPS